MTDGKFVKVYYAIVDDERFANVFHDARHLGTWLQLLLVADAMYPAPAPVPAYVSRASLKVLVDAGLIEVVMHQHYRVHGLASEREMRSQSARIAAASRWQSERNADPMPTRTEQNRTDTEQSNAYAGHEDDDGRDDLEAWLLAKHRIPTPRQREWLDRYCDTFDVTGPQRAAKIILSHPDDPIAALKADRDAFLHERSEAITVEPKPSSRRSGSGLTGVSAELAKMWRQQEEGEA